MTKKDRFEELEGMLSQFAENMTTEGPLTLLDAEEGRWDPTEGYYDPWSTEKTPRFTIGEVVSLQLILSHSQQVCGWIHEINDIVAECDNDNN